MFNCLSRRQFVKMTSGFVAGTAAAGSLSLASEKTQAAVVSSILSKYRPALAHNPNQNSPSYVSWTTPTTELYYAFSNNPNLGNWSSSARGIGGGPIEPALTFFNNQLYIAFTDSTKQLRLGYMQNDGFNFPVSNLPYLTSNHGPALSFHLGQLYMAWTGTNGKLNMIASANPSQAGSWSQGPYRLSESSNHGPALATYNNQIWLAWTGTDGQINSISATDINDPALYKVQKNMYYEASIDGPALGTLNTSLYLAWTGKDKHLNYVSIAGAPSMVKSCFETSNYGSAVDNYNGDFYLAWVGTDNQLKVSNYNSLRVSVQRALGNR